MKFELLKERLQQAVGWAEHATGKRLPLAVLGKLLLEVVGKELIIRATNLDLGIEIKVPAKVQGTGKVAVAGNLIESYLANLTPQTALTAEIVGSNLALTTPNSSVIIATEAPDDFPGLPLISKKEISNQFEIQAVDLSTGLGSVVFAASLGEMKPELAGVYMYQDGNENVFVATDSFRLAEKRISQNPTEGNEQKGVIIPAKNVAELLRVIEGRDEMIKVEHTKNQIVFKGLDFTLTSRLTEGMFPSYTHLIPTSFKTQVVALKEDIMSALKLTHVFADRFHQVTLKVMPDEGLFEIDTKNQERGESTVRVDATTEGESLELSVNARYLLDCLQLFHKDSVSVGFNGKDKAALIRAVGDRSFSYLAMPLNR